MIEVLIKMEFLRELNLEAIRPFNESSMILEQNVHASSNQYSNLYEKNNNVITGYENYYIKHGSKKLYPSVDFDFIGKDVVCQKCFQKFDSKTSYIQHIDANICYKIHYKPNEVYLQYKKRNLKNGEKKNKNNFYKYYEQDVNNNMKNSDMLNTLQTRNNCYIDVVYKPKNARKKRMIISTNNNEPTVKKPRGRPETLISMTVNSANETDNGFNNNLESHETELNEARKAHCSIVIKAKCSSFDTLANQFWKILRSASSINDPFNREKSEENSNLQLIKEVFSNLKILERDFIILFGGSKHHKMHECQEKAECMLSKLKEICDEYEKYISKFDVKNESTTDKGKENIDHGIKTFDGELEINIKKVDFDTFENWFNLNNGNTDTTSSTTSMGCYDL